MLKHISVRVTDDCNLSCPDCYVLRKSRYMSLDTYLSKILIPFAEMGGKSIGFTGGEPLLHNQIIEFIREAKQQGFMTSLVTNGLLLNAKIIDELEDAGLDRIQISMDTVESKLFDDIREEGFFEELTQRIIPRLNKSSIKLTVVAILNNFRENDIEAYIKKLIDLDIKSVYFRRKIRSNPTYDNFESDENDDLLKDLLQLKKEKSTLISIQCGDPIFCTKWVKDNDVNIEGKVAGCSAGITTVAIDVQGEVYPCTRVPVKLGNISDNPLDSIISTSQIIKRLRMRNLSGKCSKCKNKYICGGCRAEAYYANGDMFSEDKFCKEPMHEV